MIVVSVSIPALLKAYEQCVDLGTEVQSFKARKASYMAFDMSYFNRGTVEFIRDEHGISMVEGKVLSQVRLPKPVSRIIFDRMIKKEI